MAEIQATIVSMQTAYKAYEYIKQARTVYSTINSILPILKFLFSLSTTSAGLIVTIPWAVFKGTLGFLWWFVSILWAVFKGTLGFFWWAQEGDNNVRSEDSHGSVPKMLSEIMATDATGSVAKIPWAVFEGALGFFWWFVSIPWAAFKSTLGFLWWFVSIPWAVFKGALGFFWRAQESDNTVRSENSHGSVSKMTDSYH